MSGGGPSSKRDSQNATRVEDAGGRTTGRAAETGHADRQGVFLVTSGADAGRVITIDAGGLVTFGRSEKCSARFDDDNLSRVHSKCVRLADAYLIDDAQSTNGTFVNGVRVTKPTPLQDGDAIGLGRSTRMRFALVDAFERDALVAMHAARKRGVSADFGADHEADLEQARQFQQRLLAEVPSVPGVRIETLYRPLERVGGDLYRLHVLADGTLRILVADAVGHGVSASLTTMLVVSAYESVKHRDAVEDALSALNDAVTTRYAHAGLQLTATLLDLDFTRGECRHAIAAHPSPIIVRGGEIIEIAGAGPIVGLVADIAYERTTVALRRDDRVVAYTDGCTDVLAPGGDLLGDAGWCAALRAASGSDFTASLSAYLDGFAGGKSLTDDVTVVSAAWT